MSWKNHFKTSCIGIAALLAACADSGETTPTVPGTAGKLPPVEPLGSQAPDAERDLLTVKAPVPSSVFWDVETHRTGESEVRIYRRGDDVIRQTVARGRVIADQRCISGEFQDLNASDEATSHMVSRDEITLASCKQQALGIMALPAAITTGEVQGVRGSLDGKDVLQYVVPVPEGHCSPAMDVPFIVDATTGKLVQHGIAGNEDFPLRKFLHAPPTQAEFSTIPALPAFKQIEVYRKFSAEKMSTKMRAALPDRIDGVPLDTMFAYQYSKTMAHPTYYAMYTDTASNRSVHISYTEGRPELPSAQDREAANAGVPLTNFDTRPARWHLSNQEAEGRIQIAATDARGMRAGIQITRPNLFAKINDVHVHALMKSQ